MPLMLKYRLVIQTYLYKSKQVDIPLAITIPIINAHNESKSVNKLGAISVGTATCPFNETRATH